MKNIIKAYFTSTEFLLELFAVLTPVILFIDLSLISPFTNKQHIPTYSIIFMLAANIVYLILLRFLADKTKRIFTRLHLSASLIPISLFVVTRLLFLDTIPRWDGAVYFQALVNSISTFDFGFISVFYFNWFGHPSMGFGIITSILRLLAPTNIFLMQITNILLGILAIYSFYKIYQFFFGKKNIVENILLTSIFSLHPLFFSVSTSYLPDFGVLVFFLAAIASFLFDRLLLAFFFSFLLVFSKEIGVYSLTIFSVSYISLVQLKNWIGSKKITDPKILVMITPIIMLLIYYSAIKWNIWSGNGTSVLAVGDNCFFCFGFRTYNILQNLSIIFILNFNWIFTLFGATFLLKQQIFYPAKIPQPTPLVKLDIFRCLMLVLIGFTVFYISFINYVIPAYVLMSVPLLILFFNFSLINISFGKVSRILILCSVLILVLFQTFRNTDPVSSKIFGTFTFGNHEEIKVGSEHFADGFVYNTQYIFIDKLLKSYISTSGISPDDNFVFLDSRERWNNFFSGWGGYPINIDNTSHLRTFSTKKSFLPNTYLLQNPETLPNKAIYLYFPWMSKELEVLKRISQYYVIDNIREFGLGEYRIKVFSLTGLEYKK